MKYNPKKFAERFYKKHSFVMTRLAYDGFVITPVYEKSEEGGYLAYIKEIQSVLSQGDTKAEAKSNLYDVYKLTATYKLSQNKLIPGDVFHPGELLKDEIKHRKISQKLLAEKMRINKSYLNKILRGKVTISGTMAQKFEKALKIKAEVILAIGESYLTSVGKRNRAVFEKH